MRQVVLTHGEDGYWAVECPSLPGCVSQGRHSREEALSNILKAIDGYIAALQEDGIPVPEDPEVACSLEDKSGNFGFNPAVRRGFCSFLKRHWEFSVEFAP
jgi:predicted RNase H-like HicB family nuclease